METIIPPTRLFADKTISIDTPASVVWDILIRKEFGSQWSVAFAQLRIESDWKIGSPVLWKKDDGTAAVEGTVTALEPQKLLRFSVIDTSNPLRALVRSDEDGITFMLAECDGKTILRVRHGDFSVLEDAEEALRGTAESWERTLVQIKSLAESVLGLQSEGFTGLRICPIPPDKDLPEHTHDEHTVHVILDGGLIIIDSEGTRTFTAGDRVDFPAGTIHKARGTTDSGRMIIGMKL